MAFEEALGRLKAFEERMRWHTQAGGERADGQLMLMKAQWAVRRRQRNNGVDNDGTASTASGGGGKRRGCCYNCGQRGHFKRHCTRPRQAAAAAEQALIAAVDDDVRTALL